MSNWGGLNEEYCITFWSTGAGCGRLISNPKQIRTSSPITQPGVAILAATFFGHLWLREDQLHILFRCWFAVGRMLQRAVLLTSSSMVAKVQRTPARPFALARAHTHTQGQ